MFEPNEINKTQSFDKDEAAHAKDDDMTVSHEANDHEDHESEGSDDDDIVFIALDGSEVHQLNDDNETGHLTDDNANDADDDAETDDPDDHDETTDADNDDEAEIVNADSSSSSTTCSTDDEDAEGVTDQTLNPNHRHHPGACTVCGEEPKEGEPHFRAGCSHTYCAQCITIFFEQCLGRDTWAPPHCCKQFIPLNHARRFLPAKVVAACELAEQCSLIRVYCANKHCSKALYGDDIQQDIATCKNCLTTTCVQCMNPGHKGGCILDENTQLLMDLCARKGWKQCYRCNHMVSRMGGCSHIACRCGAQMCYACGSPWDPTAPCNCTASDESDDNEDVGNDADDEAEVNHEHHQAEHETVWATVESVSAEHPGLIHQQLCIHDTENDSVEEFGACEECGDIHCIRMRCRACASLLCFVCTYSARAEQQEPEHEEEGEREE